MFFPCTGIFFPVFLGQPPTFALLILRVLPASALPSLPQEGLASSGHFLLFHTYTNIMHFPS